MLNDVNVYYTQRIGANKLGGKQYTQMKQNFKYTPALFVQTYQRELWNGDTQSVLLMYIPIQCSLLLNTRISVRENSSVTGLAIWSEFWYFYKEESNSILPLVNFTLYYGASRLSKPFRIHSWNIWNFRSRIGVPSMRWISVKTYVEIQRGMTSFVS